MKRKEKNNKIERICFKIFPIGRNLLEEVVLSMSCICRLGFFHGMKATNPENIFLQCGKWEKTKFRFGIWKAHSRSRLVACKRKHLTMKIHQKNDIYGSIIFTDRTWVKNLLVRPYIDGITVQQLLIPKDLWTDLMVSDAL